MNLIFLDSDCSRFTVSEVIITGQRQSLFAFYYYSKKIGSEFLYLGIYDKTMTPLRFSDTSIRLREYRLVFTLPLGIIVKYAIKWFTLYWFIMASNRNRGAGTVTCTCSFCLHCMPHSELLLTEPIMQFRMLTNHY